MAEDETKSGGEKRRRRRDNSAAPREVGEASNFILVGACAWWDQWESRGEMEMEGAEKGGVRVRLA